MIKDYQIWVLVVMFIISMVVAIVPPRVNRKFFAKFKKVKKSNSVTETQS